MRRQTISGRAVVLAACWGCLTVGARAAPAQDASSARAGVARADTVRRPVAIEYSDWYGRRLTIHRVGSYAMLPLFAGTYLLGDRLLDPGSDPSWVRSAHGTAAFGTAVLFGTNTVTGAWNLWDARRDPAGRTRRTIHSVLLLVADAGFVYTGSLAEDAEGEEDEGRTVDQSRAATATPRSCRSGSAPPGPS
jgi:hypothetical protein